MLRRRRGWDNRAGAPNTGTDPSGRLRDKLLARQRRMDGELVGWLDCWKVGRLNGRPQGDL